MSVSSVFAVFASRDEAEQIARTVIDERLAACANILPDVQSFYRWEGKIEEAREVATLFKTTTTAADALIARIADLHSYDVPCVLSTPVDKVLASYADWVEREVRG